ncbi:MAG TPA: hypothetical protein VFE33_04455 [Thermoanaerobaculia bacterium]|nr:hypothetical protein [Thermoanaerobaculia bacterium]
MKKMERIDDQLFRPLTPAQTTRVTGGVTTQTAVTLVETSNPAPDFSRDGDRE